MAKNEKYSHKSLKKQDLTKEPAKDFNNSEIVGACFYKQNAPRSTVFPAGMTGVEFIDCNLDNCVVPPGNTVTRGTNKQFAEQKDGEKWIVNTSDEPTEPLRKAEYEKYSLSIDPAGIPITARKSSILADNRADAKAMEEIS